jgi:hypothetical protein
MRQTSPYALLGIGIYLCRMRSTSHHPDRCRFHSRTWTSLYILALSAPFASVARLVDGFQRPIMEYRPPVKSSVSKLLHGNSGPKKNCAIATPRGSGGASPAGVQNAHAIAYGGTPSPASASSSVSSFERRMRELVLGRSPERPSSQTSVDSSSETSQPIPSNVRLVQNLADYKRLVGEERSRIVVVRFYASWCRVRATSFGSLFCRVEPAPHIQSRTRLPFFAVATTRTVFV